jgi:hypothetical protein
MLNTLLRRIAASLVGAVLAAFSAGVTAIAAAFALYALLRLSLPPAAAAAIDAGVFAVLTGALALSLPGLWKRPKPKARAAPAIDPTLSKVAADAAMAVLGAVAEQARGRSREAKAARDAKAPREPVKPRGKPAPRERK